MKRLFFAALTGTAISAFWLSRRYRRDMNAARARLAAFERHVIATPWGQVEYAEQGTGAPVLVVPGIYQHCISGLLSVRGLLPGRRLIAPSRFGYLGSSLPSNTEGYNFDLYVSNADVNSYNLEAIRVPTLIVHTKDDQLASHEASRRAAERIPGARFVSLESGGHMMLRQEKNLAELASFLAPGGSDASRISRVRRDRGAVLVSHPPVDEPVGRYGG